MCLSVQLKSDLSNLLQEFPGLGPPLGAGPGVGAERPLCLAEGVHTEFVVFFFKLPMREYLPCISPFV